MIGRMLSHYRVVREIGSGGMGVVYLARDEHLHCDVALKVLPTGLLNDETARQRFRREALTLAARPHPNIVTVHDFDTQDGIDFLVMEHVDGPSLSEELDRGSLPDERVTAWGVEMAKGLAAAHEAGVVHRDVKPGNLKLSRDGLKILDFGLAKWRPRGEVTSPYDEVTKPGHAPGTLPYMAPELLTGSPADERSDIYSAGVVLYQMAAGKLPHASSDRSALARDILSRVPPPPSRWNPVLRPELEQVILRAMHKDPARRYASARELAAALERAALALSRPVRRPRPRRWAIPATALACFGVLLAIPGVRARVAGLLGDGHAPPAVSLAVLPLENLSRDPDQEYFAEGMTQELITALAQVRGIHVISRTSVMEFKGTRLPAPVIAKRLGVRQILEGTVLRAGSRVRIHAQLVDAARDRHLWAQSYDREIRDLLALQADVAREISNQVHVTLSPRERERLRRSAAVSPPALEAYLRGLYHWNRREPNDVQRAIALFQQAVRLDSTFAKPHAGLADAFAQLANYGALPQASAYGIAKAEALRAIELDPGLGEAHASLAQIRMDFEWDWAEAERGFRHAIRATPGHATAHQWYADLLSRLGRTREALEKSKRALSLDPLSPPVNGQLGTVYYYGRRPDEAIRQYRAALRLQPNQVLTRLYLGLALLETRSYGEALAEFERCERDAGGLPLTRAGLGCAYAFAGRHEEARGILEELRARSSREPVPPSYLALVCVGLREHELALRYMEEALEARDSYLGHIKVLPLLDPLRREPRFQSLLRRVGLADPPASIS